MKPEPTWRHTVRADDGHSTVALTGEIDMNGAPTLHDLLHDIARTASTVTVDLAEVTFIDSTIIGALVTAHNEAIVTGRSFAVINAVAQVRRVLEITGVLDTLAADNP